MSGCGRVPYPVGFGIGVVAVSGDHRSGFGLGFGLGIGVATVLRDQRCIRDPVSLCFPLAGLSAKSPQVFPSVRASFARRVMGRVRDSSVTRDASFLARSCGGVCVAHQMVRQLAQDVNSAEEVLVLVP